MNKTKKFTLYSLNLYYHLIIGLIGGSFQAALPAFMENLNANAQQISIGFSLQAVFNCIGNLLGTYYLAKLNRQLVFAFSIIIIASLNIYTPLCTDLNIFYVIMSLGGLIGAFIGQIPSVWTVEIFKGNHKTYIQILHTFYAIGDFLSPLTVAPFLKSKVSKNDNFDFSFYQNFFSMDNREVTEDAKKIFLPYLVMSCLRLSVSFFLIITYFLMPYKKLDEEEQNLIQNETTNDVKPKKPKSFIICFTILMCFVFSLGVGTNSNFSNFLTTFLLKLDYGFSKQQAAYTMMIYKASILLGRFLTSLIISKIREKIMICFNLSLMLASCTLMIVLGFTNLNVLYISIFLIGLGFSSNYPLIFSYVEKHTKLTDSISSIFAFGSNFFDLFSQSYCGYLLDVKPISFLIFNIILISITIVIFFMLNIMQYLFRRKNVEETQEVQ